MARRWSTGDASAEGSAAAGDGLGRGERGQRTQPGGMRRVLVLVGAVEPRRTIDGAAAAEVRAGERRDDRGAAVQCRIPGPAQAAAVPIGVFDDGGTFGAELARHDQVVGAPCRQHAVVDPEHIDRAGVEADAVLQGQDAHALGASPALRTRRSSSASITRVAAWPDRTQGRCAAGRTGSARRAAWRPVRRRGVATPVRRPSAARATRAIRRGWRARRRALPAASDHVRARP